MAEIYNDGLDDTDLGAPNQYLAWGGESEGYSVVTVDEIKKSVETEHYSGITTWEHYVLLRPAETARPRYVPVEILGLYGSLRIREFGGTEIFDTFEIHLSLDV